MTERMQEYRQKMEDKGYVQVRIWVEKQDEKFVKFLAEFCREERKSTRAAKKRFGRRASPQQITLAKAFASANGVAEPEHLYDYHISLAAWIWRYKGRPFI